MDDIRTVEEEPIPDSDPVDEDEEAPVEVEEEA